MATDNSYYTRCIGWEKWRLIGIIVGWATFVASYIALLSILNSKFWLAENDFEDHFHYERPSKYEFIVKISFGLTNFWAIVCFLYGVTFYRPVCMLVGLIWYFFLGVCFTYSVYTGDNKLTLKSPTVYAPLLVFPYCLCIFSYEFIKKSTDHIRRNGASIPMSNLTFVTVQRMDRNPS
ncbi:uncharacterized protein LOC129574490 isoform X1 [Sitodiplosis mosellana]|uniref:uncharacterized protein LOC129574490 isoform X1 n=1 Tax=Sitodiplosis mosellana TaxID=263140 RepID=UPI0024452650|nr:uncharacterized protein LOC129574490 isoform X1 [Sitodiplosis mosellana]XP_055312546.1 uncharacterized protein LOC129574490 isoform X1 [Sitodiplosis mosellana]XP_055312547.1 uncharacterized protein LOC129574490 isoform X1 [Sitodiplosis mosellana]